MATKKVTTKKPAAKTTKTVAKAPAKATKKDMASIYNTNVSVLLAMAIEALILLLAYLVIMNAA